MTARELAAADAFFARSAAEPCPRRRARAPPGRAGDSADHRPRRRGTRPRPRRRSLLAVNEANVARFGSPDRGDRRLAGPATGRRGRCRCGLDAGAARRPRERPAPGLAPAARGGRRVRRCGSAAPCHADRSSRGAWRASSRCTARSCCWPTTVRSSIRCRSSTPPGSRSDVVRSGCPESAADAPYLDEGDLIPYGPDRGSVPVNQWPMVVEGHVSVEASPGGRRAPRSSHLGHAAGRSALRAAASAGARARRPHRDGCARDDRRARVRPHARRRGRARRAAPRAQRGHAAGRGGGGVADRACSTGSRIRSTSGRPCAPSTRPASTGSSCVAAGRRRSAPSRARPPAPAS